jgi:hypothetical protein
MKITRAFPALVLALTALAVAPVAVQADTIPLASGPGLEGLGSYTGSLSYDQSTQLLEITLTNTSLASNGGYITAFAFNIPTDASVSTVSFSSTDASFSLLSGPIDAQPFGSFDLGASITSSFQGGGAPQPGIAVGDSATFTFDLTGNAILAGLSAAEWLDALSTGAQGGGEQSFVVRFRGFEDGGSDKVPSKPVPEPGTLALLGAGALGLWAKFRRRAAAL